ncbi:MAG: flagellar filament outer layer protein FlaA [Treponema sp.]|jgi:hypothetical protein|nr:flagellar filament outer layer protein FlaA [Treponema sp.]
MKQGSFKMICLIIWACIAVFSVYSDELTISYETRVLESFNGDADAPYRWKTEASKFTTRINNVSYPLLTYVEAWPISAFGYNRTGEASSLRSLGLNGRFDRMGYNWIDLYPVLANDPDENPYEIQIPGRVINMDMWVWGANLKFYIDVFVRDYRGVIHSIRLGDIAYAGWRNLRVNVPTTIPQSRRILPSYAGLTFVKFRIWTQPVERVDNFYIYFKQLKVLTDMFETYFDGNDLADPQNVERFWVND